MKVDFSLKRKVLGLLCILWNLGLLFSLGVIAEGLRGGITNFFTRGIFYFLIPPYSIWLLPCFLTGIYQLFLKQQEKLDKVIFYVGLILSIVGLLLFTRYNPSAPEEHSVLAIIVGAGLFTLLNGVWNVEGKERKLFSKIRTIVIILIIIFLPIVYYSAVYGKPFLSDPLFWSFLGQNVYKEPGGNAIAELKFIKSDGTPLQLEVCLTSENVPGLDPPDFCSFTNKDGVTVFKIHPDRYLVGFNFVNFPQNLVVPEEQIWIELKEGETIKKTFELESK